MKFSKRNLLFVFVGLIGLIGLGYLVLPQNTKKSVRRSIKRQYLILTGGMVNVGGYYLRIECQGKGSPTVVLDSGLNMPMKSWETVPEEVSKFTRVCVYERAGIGESDAAPEQLRTSKNVVNDLNKLLTNAGEKSPFILAGHSVGGLNMRLYASLFPQEIVGLILVDSSHPDQYQRLANIKSEKDREEYLKNEGGDNSERLNILASAEEIRTAKPIQPIPVMILSAENEKAEGEELRFMKDHNELQADLVKISPNGKLIVVKDSGHFIQKDKPEIVINSIKSIFEASH